MKIDSIIPFCSYDIKFIKHTINGIKDISDNIYIVYCNKLFNGEDEDFQIIKDVKNEHSYCNFIELKFDSSKNSRWHHNMGRFICSEISNAEYILYVDADEVFEGDKLSKWIQENKLKDVTTFANYWYFRDTRYRSKTYEDSPVLVKKSIINNKIAFHELERGIFKHLNVDICLSAMYENFPMCHHYSWVLTKEQMLKKVSNWGHSGDKNWNDCIEEEFSRPFNGTDFVHNYQYHILEKGYI